MKATFETEDAYEIKQIPKANDMAIMLWDLYNKKIREMTEKDRQIVLNLFEEHNIDINDLTY